MLKFKRLSAKAFSPKKGTFESAGYDLFAAHPCEIRPFTTELVFTDLAIQVPEGCYGRIASRSSLSIKGLEVCSGVIDRDYTGNVAILLYNKTQFTFPIESGDKIAQLICEKCSYPELEEVEELDKTERGEKAFGSTGHNNSYYI